MSTLEERLERLERRNEGLEARNRLFTRSALGLGGLVGVALLMGQAAAKDGDKAKFKSIVVEQVTVVDKAGKIRMEIGVDKQGAGLDIRDANGKVRVAIGEGTITGLGDGAGTWVFDEKERPRVGLGVGKDGNGLIVLDENGKPVAGEGKER